MDIYFYYVNQDYIEYLKQAEREFREFTCVPVSSYSKNQQDLILMKDKQDSNKILGSLRFTYMIPVWILIIIKIRFIFLRNLLFAEETEIK